MRSIASVLVRSAVRAAASASSRLTVFGATVAAAFKAEGTADVDDPSETATPRDPTSACSTYGSRRNNLIFVAADHIEGGVGGGAQAEWRRRAAAACGGGVRQRAAARGSVRRRVAACSGV